MPIITYSKEKRLKAGDELLRINGNKIRDVLDYQFYITEKVVTLSLLRDQEPFEITIKKPQYDDIGIEFESYLMDKLQNCHNNCIFCFIDQNPKGMRKPIYFKDDDHTMSFLSGNYITLTNMTFNDIDRIVKMKIKPVNISVHTTNPTLRCKILNNKNAGNVLEYLQVFYEHDIDFNCQIVCCKGINDGEELKKTLLDLSKFAPVLKNVSVVPAGLTKHRKGLYPLEEFSKEDASEVLDIIENAPFKEVYPSDEFYLKAERDFPAEDFYNEFPQLENGVGMSALFKADVLYALESQTHNFSKRKTSIATGTAAKPLIDELIKAMKVNCNVYAIKNNFYGKSVTVAGLVTGNDIYEQLKNIDLGEELFIPKTMLRYDGDLFLDDMSLDELSKKLNIKVTQVPVSGDEFIRIFE